MFGTVVPGEMLHSFVLRPDPPYRLDLTVWTLRRRGRNEIDRWDGRRYVRALLVGGSAMEVRVEQVGGVEDPLLRVDVTGPADVDEIACADVRSHVSRLLGVDTDLRKFYELADGIPGVGVLRDRFLGVRPPRFPGIFEALTNAVANQQLSLEVGLTLLNRLTSTFGTKVSGNRGLAAFPSAVDLVVADPDQVRQLGFSARKTDYLVGIADALTTGVLDEAELERSDRATALQLLLAIRGVGRWSAEYVLLRGLGRLEVYPGDDVGARNALRRFFRLDHDPGYDEIAERVDPLQPVAGLLYFHLLLDGLAERGELDA